MPTPPKHGKEQLERRRDIIRSLITRGVNTPGRILKQKSVDGIYDDYKNPYDTVKKDIEAVRKSFLVNAREDDNEMARAELLMEIEEMVQQAWSDYGKLEGRPKVAMLTQLVSLYKDKARLRGVDPERIDVQYMKVGNVTTNVENNSYEVDPELKEDVAQLSKAFDEVAELFESQAVYGTGDASGTDGANLPEDNSE